ncbi:MAG: alkaline phosphatase family protein [Tenericutes bacterium]|nr:alkaline phosphatase family protein [Mycoplasmatota bacterium]
MKNIVFPDYNRSLMNITTSILKYYGVKSNKASLSILEDELNKNYRNVVYILVDAMGTEVLKKHKKQASFLLENKIETLTTVFPSTTVAATVSALTGKSPIENGWIGWLQYIKEEDKSVIFFYNKDFYDETVEFDYDVSEKYVPVTKIYQQIEEVNDDVEAIEIFPEFRTPEHKTFRDMTNTIIKDCKKEGKKFIYAYWDKLDTYLHKTGTKSLEVRNHIEEINSDIRYLSESLDDDTLIIVTADHGMIDIEEIELWKFDKIIETFTHNPSIEARATAFFIKEGMEEQFVTEFNKNFKESFILYKSEDAIITKICGEGVNHPKAKEFLGDYFSIAIDKYSFKLSNSKRAFKAQHAGLTKEEMLIPLIVIRPKK